MRIIVITLKNGEYDIETQSTDKILDFKTKILSSLSIQPNSESLSKVQIIYHKKICKDDQIISNLHITDGTRIFANLSSDLISSISGSNMQSADSSCKSSISSHSTASSTTSINDECNFCFPNIITNQEIYSPNQTQDTYTTGVSSSNPIVVPRNDYFPQTPMEFANFDKSSYESNVNLLVSLGYNERSARNILKFTGNIFHVAENALKKGVFQDEESNKLAESLDTITSPEKRTEIINILIKELIYKTFHELSDEDKEFKYKNALKAVASLQNYVRRYENLPDKPMIQQSRLSPNENEILPLLRNALNGVGGFSNNPFAIYLESKDDESFFDLNGKQSEELFDKFLQASTLETEQWKFVAKCMLRNMTLNEGLYYLECANYDPVAAASLI